MVRYLFGFVNVIQRRTVARGNSMRKPTICF
jgi:hypothetical protein